MSTIQEIENAIQRMSPPELAAFRDWFQKFDAQNWDRQLEKDVAAGKLDKLAEQALRDFADGRCDEL